jgi:hypothetical protein
MQFDIAQSVAAQSCEQNCEEMKATILADHDCCESEL